MMRRKGSPILGVGDAVFCSCGRPLSFWQTALGEGEGDGLLFHLAGPLIAAAVARGPVLDRALPDEGNWPKAGTAAYIAAAVVARRGDVLPMEIVLARVSP